MATYQDLSHSYQAMPENPEAQSVFLTSHKSHQKQAFRSFLPLLLLFLFLSIPHFFWQVLFISLILFWLLCRLLELERVEKGQGEIWRERK